MVGFDRLLNENINSYIITHKKVRASSLTSSLLPSSASSPSDMISSQSFNLFTISSMRSAPQLSHGPAPVGQFSLLNNKIYEFQ